MAGLKIRSVLVTGSNRGIGLEFVKQFAEAPKPPELIFAACRNPEAAQSQELKDLAAKHPNIVVVKLEITDPASVDTAVKSVQQKLKGAGLSLLINNAAIMSPSTLETLTAEDMMNVYATNVIGPMLVTKALHPLLKKGAQENCSKSSIVHISAGLGSMEEVPSLFTAFPAISYRCSKAALNMLSRCHAEGYKEDGIISIAIHPGWVQTDMGGRERAPLTPKKSMVR
ncbi:uncharacterized protein LOC115470474 [Microcaecilia unicolor]|uniref:Uncharacterized protein LOC115470474 n=1 Tax=Microcaecilia unicolor TaxID=1415580 RepID=A0A6P7Y9N6_9AMPH|nr:uncharacterized protein LOC115470474 [Microcaecilia unicolor]